MNIKRLLAIVSILICTATGWVLLGTGIVVRTNNSAAAMGRGVAGLWGPPMIQQHPTVHYKSPGAADGRHRLQPAAGEVAVELGYEPKKKGLFWHRTYTVGFKGRYRIENPTPIAQTIFVRFQLPDPAASYNDFSFVLGGKASTDTGRAADGITEAVNLPAGSQVELEVAYRTRGTDRWGYGFGDAPRIRNFRLAMTTDFAEIDFPAGTGSPTARAKTPDGWAFTWAYPDVLGAQPVGMEMPKVLNPGPVAARITFFAPVSILFFFTVLVLLAVVRRVDLHPVNYFFLAAGFFAFQLLFAYLVDLAPLHLAFAVAAAVSLTLVAGYLWLVAGRGVARLAALAQLAYMVLFSYTFFFDGLTGLAITIGAIVTLAILMVATARIDWSQRLGPTPPPLPQDGGAVAGA